MHVPVHALNKSVIKTSHHIELDIVCNSYHAQVYLINVFIR